ncbi:MAG: NAD(+) kinase [Thiofilum sp.]|uniref:NAD(+) kinase n=1 Tax=Thiofilum sp. TaxID=2212733 RepID=UPI0025D0D569|nr:NAD(+) kinase [Thiofilum sp.]MBK8452018.1 NAD(+) kinase [Thiofilum sp.]
MGQFNRIGIFAKRDDLQIHDTLISLTQYLSELNYTFYLDKYAGSLLQQPCHTLPELAQIINLAIVVGGDGTLLSVGRMMSAYNIPVVGVNRGRVGFLVDIKPQELHNQLGPVLAGNFHEEQRTLLQAEAWRGEELLGQGKALNDVVIHARDQVRMIEFTTYIDKKFVHTQHADGIVVSTPTGSTAYALSSGGPIMHPELNAIVMVPVCPHTLTQRPLVVGGNSLIELHLCTNRPINSRVSFDGHNDIDLESGDRVHITQSKDRLRLLHPQGYDYYHILRTKLYWGLQL